MDVNARRLAESLRALFVNERIVFWCDNEGQFSGLIDSLELADDVQVIKLEQVAVMAVKIQLERESATRRFLLYSTAPEPAPASDWLLDVRLRSKTYRADLASILIEDLGLASLTLVPYIRSRERFLAAEARRSRLKRLIESGDDANSLDRKMLAVLLRSEESDGLSIALRLLHSLWTPGHRSGSSA